MTDPRLTVDSKNNLFKNPIGFIANHQELSKKPVTQFKTQAIFIDNHSAVSTRNAIANKVSAAIAFGATATFLTTTPLLPSVKLPHAGSLLKPTNLAESNTVGIAAYKDKEHGGKEKGTF